MVLFKTTRWFGHGGKFCDCCSLRLRFAFAIAACCNDRTNSVVLHHRRLRQERKRVVCSRDNFRSVCGWSRCCPESIVCRDGPERIDDGRYGMSVKNRFCAKKIAVPLNCNCVCCFLQSLRLPLAISAIAAVFDSRLRLSLAIVFCDDCQRWHCRINFLLLLSYPPASFEDEHRKTNIAGK